MTSPSGNPLRAAIVIGHLGYGGAERQLTELVLRGGDLGMIPHVLCMGGSDEPYGPLLRERGVPVTRIVRRSGFDLTRVLRLASHLRSESFDLVHSFLIDTNPYAFLAARLARVPVFIASNRNADFPREWYRRPFDRLAFRSASAVVVNAMAVREFTVRTFRVPADRLAVIYNGVDLERFRPRPDASDGVLRIGTIGSLAPKKNPGMFLAVSSIVSRRFPEARSLHLGDGPLEAELRAHPGPVHFLGTSARAEEFLATLDVFLLTSQREGCPNVLLEAMASGVPPVATDAGGSAEVIRDRETGYVTPRNDPEAMASRVCDLLADAELRHRMGRAARLDAERRFPVERMVAETVGLYRRLVAGERSSPQ